MNYFFIAFLTTSGSAFAIYFLYNRVLRVKIQLIPLLICAAISLFLSTALPKIIVRFADWLGTLAALFFLALICSYLLAYYETETKQTKNAIAEHAADSQAQQPLHMCDTNTVIPVAEAEAAAAVYPTDRSDSAINADSAQEQILATVQVCINEGLNTDYDNLSVDQLLDHAFELKEQKEYYLAASVLQKVLERNKDSSAAPLLIFEIASALQHSHAAKEAADFLLRSLHIPAVAENPFIENRALAMIADIQKTTGTGGLNNEKES